MLELTEKAGIIVLASHNEGLIKKTCNKVLALERAGLKYFGDIGAYFNVDARSA